MAQQTNWAHKESRELFAKAVNSMLMTLQDLDSLDKYIECGKMIVDKAFEYYPDEVKDNSEVDFPVK